jgi:hypothetical protein
MNLTQRLTGKEPTGKAKLSVVRKLRLKDRRDDTAEGVELHSGADLGKAKGLFMQC